MRNTSGIYCAWYFSSFVWRFTQHMILHFANNFVGRINRIDIELTFIYELFSLAKRRIIWSMLRICDCDSILCTDIIHKRQNLRIWVSEHLTNLISVWTTTTSTTTQSPTETCHRNPNKTKTMTRVCIHAKKPNKIIYEIATSESVNAFLIIIFCVLHNVSTVLDLKQYQRLENISDFRLFV